MSIVTTDVILSYVSTSDISSVNNNGSIKYQIFFDQTVATLGNIIMFEYKLQDTNSTIPDLDNTSFGYISVENAIQSGIVNQYMLAVPAEEDTNDGISNKYIQIRIYTGELSSGEVVVTDWSNQLNVYNPPATPVINVAYYDNTNYLSDTIYIYINFSENTYTDYDNIKFIVCYWYQDVSNNTVWSVSDHVTAQTSPNVTGYKYLEVPNIGKVSSTNTNIYVSVHAVYSWQHNGNNYFSVSYISNELTGIPASNDNTPDITSVVYNVYVDEGIEPDVPGNQTMTVNWVPPGNYLIPFFNVDYYSVYYKLNNTGPYILYLGEIEPSTNTLTVDITALPTLLGNTVSMVCGDSIVYQVWATTINDVNEISTDSDSVNFFKYSQPVTDLTITNTSVNSVDNTISLTVNFTGVSDNGSPNKGCGNGQSYVVKINDIVYSSSSTLAYTSGASYSIQYTGIDATTTGDVTVYLQTENTNASPVYAMDGQSLTVPYITDNVVLSPIDYQVYSYGNTDQNMILSWTNPVPVPAPWSVSSYEVELEVNNNDVWLPVVSTSNTTYTYNAESYANTINNLNFRVKAVLVNELTTYTQVSNEESTNTFKYSTEPYQSIVNWSSGNASSTSMDLNVTFKNPLYEGVNNGLQYFDVQIYTDESVLINSQQISYVSGNGLYTVGFNDVTYSATGYVKISPYVTDTNSIVNLTYYYAAPTYITSTIPEFVNVVLTAGINLTGQIVSATPLAPFGSCIYSFNNSLQKAVLLTNGTTPGFIISVSQQPNNEYLYTFIFDFTQFFINYIGLASLPAVTCISVSNTSGVGAYPTDIN